LILLTLTLVFALIACGFVSAGTPLDENQSGTVSGDLYVNTSNPWASTVGGETNEVTQPNTIPTYTSIDSAMVYVNVYSGSGSANWPVRTTVKLDGNGDGDYDDPGELLGVEDMTSESYTTDGTVIWINDHCMRVYSDYQAWYNVTNLITNNNPTLYVKTENTGGDGYDGRIKLLALTVAYNDSDNDQVHYWVLNGQDWINSETSPSTSTFNTSSFNGEVEAASLKTVALSSTDGSYTFNGNSLSGGLTETGSYYKEHNWDVTSDINPGADSTLDYANVGGSFKMNLATLTIREAEEEADVDLTITGTVNTVPGSAVFAKETNSITIPNIKNNGSDTATDIVVALYASDVDSGNTPVATTTIASLAGGATTTINLIDPTIRNLEGSSVTYTVRLDPDNLIAETDETNNDKSTAAKPVQYNGYKGKRYWEGGSDINTSYVYDLNGNIVYFTQPASAYKAVGWTTRTENWTTTDLPVPGTSTVEDVWLYLSYNWDTTAGGKPSWTVTLNGETIDLSGMTPYIDQSNFGYYANYKYGLYVVNVTDLYNHNGDNTLIMTPNTGNSQALYPSTLAVIYSDPNETHKQIFISEECDELGVSASSYGTTMEEATAYANFTGLTIDIASVSSAILHSFAGSAGSNEGNLFFNGNSVAELAWQGTASTASALVADVTSYLTSTDNVAAIQGTNSGGMLALQQFLVLEYGADLVVTSISPNVGLGGAFFANEPNILSVTVLNNGTEDSDATTLEVNVDGEVYTVDVPALAAGASTTVTVTDTNTHTGGESVPVNANADPSNSIPETNEANNTLIANITVSNNGYKGKQYTDDDEYDYLETQEIFEGNYDVTYSSGNTVYNGASWTEKTYSWTASDLVIPAGASVVNARLYQGYTYNQMGVDPSWTMTFNGNIVDSVATYSDIKGFGSYSFPYGLYVYDVTSLFNTAGNTMTITPEVGRNYGIYGAYLIVVYEDATTSYKKIYINDGFDMVCSRYTYSVNDTEATANANFEDVNTEGVVNAQAITVIASADETNDSKFLFNGNEYTGFWSSWTGTSGPQLGFNTYDVTSALQEGSNQAGMQSYDSTGPVDTNWGDNMYAMAAILVADYGFPDLVAADLEIPENPVVGETYQINVTVTNNGASDVDSFLVRLFDNGVVIASQTISDLNANEARTINFNWKPTTYGTHTLTISTDANKQITESNETNNNIQTTINVAESPDLTPSNLQTPTNPTQGTTYPLSVTITNNSNANAGTFVVRLFDNGVVIASQTISDLNANEARTINFNWKPTTYGTHTLTISTDANKQITESNETNNNIQKTTEVT
jgi:subtilase family serine protease